MRIGIVDADLIGRRSHRFPNLASEKLSGCWKDRGADVSLILDWSELLDYGYDAIYISRVFTDTVIPEETMALIESRDNIHVGGTGFFFDRAEPLPPEIEHHMPDYHLYDGWISMQKDQKNLSAYRDLSIGFLTRGCFRHCGFCVNRNCDAVRAHSPLQEFYDPSRKKLCFLDDNFLGFSGWKKLLEEVMETGRPFKFKQGLDERLLTDEKCSMLFSAKYDGDITFAFDSIKDYNLIRDRLEMIRRHTDSLNIKFYVLTGYDSTGLEDIVNLFRRIELLFRYRCLPYVMRYMDAGSAPPWQSSEFRGMYTAVTRWCNQPHMVRTKSFREWCALAGHRALAAMEDFELKHPEEAGRWFDMRFGG